MNQITVTKYLGNKCLNEKSLPPMLVVGKILHHYCEILMYRIGKLYPAVIF